MAFFLTPLKGLVSAGLTLALGLILAPQLSTGASMNAPVAPLMLAGVPGTRTVYVVSTSNLFESSRPSACGFSCLLLERTTDGGAHFTVLDLPRTRYVGDSLTGTLDQLQFANASDGYAVMGNAAPRSLYVTHSGGRSWHLDTIADGTEILRLTTTRSHVVAIVAKCEGSSPCTDLRLATSPLVSHRWTFTPLAKWPVGMGAGLGAFASNVWLTQQTHQTVRLLTSHDLGVTFSRTSAPDLGSVYACFVTATSDASLWAQCPTGMSSSFHYSSDGGVSWNTIPVRQFTNTGGGYFDPVTSTFAFLSVGLADSLGNKNLYKITNEGRTMTATGNLPCTEVNGLVFIDARHGFAACDEHSTSTSTRLLSTSDGGLTWSQSTAFYAAV